MRRNDKSWAGLDELPEPFFKDEGSDEATKAAVELRNRIVKLEQQVLSQYTAMAGYATISKNDFESSRAEARADLDRSQATVIGLLEKLRKEISVRLDGIENRESGVDSDMSGSRVARLERAFESTMDALQQCLRENQELRTQMAELVEQRMQQQGWLVSSGTSDSLSLH
ncbi:MAG TPA: hypothetical protein VLD86_00240 [Ilumatobacteraceae bacterium]|nr:hypothetical protein [Ilumatobacteraceae bacterium]